MQKFIQYIKDVRTEMAKVSWPSRDEVVGATTLVIVSSVAGSICIKGFDLVLSKVLGVILNM